MKKLKAVPKKKVRKVKLAPCKTVSRRMSRAVAPLGGEKINEETLDLKCGRGACGHPRRIHIFNGMNFECHLCSCRDYVKPEE